MIRNETFKVRLSKPEKTALEELARQHSITPSEFLRDLLRKVAQQSGLLPELTVENQTEEFAIAA